MYISRKPQESNALVASIYSCCKTVNKLDLAKYLYFLAAGNNKIQSPSPYACNDAGFLQPLENSFDWRCACLKQKIFLHPVFSDLVFNLKLMTAPEQS